MRKMLAAIGVLRESLSFVLRVPLPVERDGSLAATDSQFDSQEHGLTAKLGTLADHRRPKSSRNKASWTRAGRFHSALQAGGRRFETCTAHPSNSCKIHPCVVATNLF